MCEIAFINCQSLNNKPDIVLDYIIDNGINVCFLAETWLKNDNDFALKCATPTGYNFINSPRSNGKGGGIATIFQNETNCREFENENAYKSFEHQTLEIEINGTKCIFAVIYRVPPSKSNHDGYARFLWSFSTY